MPVTQSTGGEHSTGDDSEGGTKGSQVQSIPEKTVGQGVGGENEGNGLYSQNNGKQGLMRIYSKDAIIWVWQIIFLKQKNKTVQIQNWV